MGAGRPRIEIDQTQFEKLCAIFCTLEEIASFFNCSEETIRRWCKRTYGEEFCEVHKKQSAKGKMSLRRYQFRLAEKNTAMAIFLGKNYLGQRDSVEADFDPESLKKAKELLDGVESAIN